MRWIGGELVRQTHSLERVAIEVVALRLLRIPDVRLRVAQIQPDLLRRSHDREVARFGDDDPATRSGWVRYSRCSLRASGGDHALRLAGYRNGLRRRLLLVVAAVGHEHTFPFAGVRVDIVHVNHEV